MNRTLLALMVLIGLERCAWYAFLGELIFWQHGGSNAVGNALLIAYLTPLLGGWLGDNYSRRGTLVAGLSLLTVGYMLLAYGMVGTFGLSTNTTSLSWVIPLGLPLIAVGCGLFKPNLTALGPVLNGNKDLSASRIYTAVQIGSLPSTVLGGFLRSTWNVEAAFLVCGLLTLIGLVVGLIAWKHLRPDEDAIIATALTQGMEAELKKPQWIKVIGLCVGAVFFFAPWNGQNTVIVLWAQRVCDLELPETVTTLNSLICGLLLCIPALASWKNAKARIVLAMVSCAMAFGLLAYAGTSSKSFGWVLAWFAFSTLGESLISPLGLSRVQSYVPAHKAGVALALWYLANAISGKIAGWLGTLPLMTAVWISICSCFAGAIGFMLFFQNEPEQVRRPADTNGLSFADSVNAMVWC